MDQFNRPFTVPAGVGSGVIYDAKGYILTNDHVIEGADQLLVTLPDGRSFKATLTGADPQTDLAVLKINGPNLPIAPLGNSAQLQVGNWVVAIGINTAKPIADQLVATGQVIHPYLGIDYIPLTPAIAAHLGITQQTGMVVGDVAAGSPALQAGLQRYDVIAAIDGKRLRGDSDLAQIVDQHRPGDTLTLTVVRDSQTMTVKVTLATRPVSMLGSFI